MTKTLLFVKGDCYQELDWLFTQVSLQSKVEQISCICSKLSRSLHVDV